MRSYMVQVLRSSSSVEARRQVLMLLSLRRTA